MKRIAPGPGQESVWDYPRPPRLESTARRIRVVFDGLVVADSTRCYRVLETSHPPTYYIPMEDVRKDLLVPSWGQSLCEFKGAAAYWSLKVGDRLSKSAAWSYPAPMKPFLEIRNHYAFYAHAVDACYVDDEMVQPQAGGFYGGWVTSDVVGPFKGAAGTQGW